MKSRIFRVVALASVAVAVSAAEVPPWEREQPLKVAAAQANLTGVLDPQQPAPGGNGGHNTLTNEQIRAALWGPSNRVTLSLLKTDVWDRRYGTAPTLTLDEVRAGAYSPTNHGFDDMPPNQRRPVRGYLRPEGGREDRYACWNAYPFPCEKPVGQIILGLDEMAGVANPPFAQRCGDGVVRLQLKSEKAQAEVEILLPMTRNVFAIRAHLTGVVAPWIRLFRHEDQAWRRYLLPDRKTFRARTPGAASGVIAAVPGPTQTPFDYAKDAAWNGPVDAPTSGTDGKYFWIRQRFPAEKTFPQGFDYVMMGLVAGPAESRVQTKNNERGLGTPPVGVRGEALSRLEDGYAAIREAPGAAATATLAAGREGEVVAYVTVVTCNEARDPMAEARRQLDAAATDGFDKIAAENAEWFAHFYDQRENGRIFTGGAGTTASENVPQVFSSWGIRHGGGNKPDMRRYESTASYANVEQDWQLWHSLPCYNELFYTPTVVRNRADSLDMWWELVEAWRPAAQANAREVYQAEGMALVHGYLPPVKADRYVHTNVALDYSIDTIAQMVKPLWDEWDYGGDVNFLQNKAYPAIRDAAQFYASYARKGTDGRYHFIPAIEAEAWGIFPEFARGKDAISALCMARWTFLRATEAAELLKVDADLCRRWREVEAQLAPYPVYETKAGLIFNSMDGTVPSHNPGDHGWYIGIYPTTLADEINLDSPLALREQMLRTAAAVPTSHSAEARLLLGVVDERTGRGGSTPEPEALLNSRSGRIHLFPAIATDESAGFRRLQARGGLLVSAAKNASGVTWLEIEARRDVTCQFLNPWPGRALVIRERTRGTKVPYRTDRTNGECLIFAASAGGDYRVDPAGEKVVVNVAREAGVATSR